MAAAASGDYVTALRLLRPLADQGDVQAQYNLGVFYDHGLGVPQNNSEAVKWYRKAADQGEDRAQNNLATMYANGQGVAQNYSEAVKWFRKAADQVKVLRMRPNIQTRSGTAINCVTFQPPPLLKWLPWSQPLLPSTGRAFAQNESRERGQPARCVPPNNHFMSALGSPHSRYPGVSGLPRERRPRQRTAAAAASKA
jgi:tetratricopeptide (TPR) repeat protein